MRVTKRELAGRLVGRSARYMPDAPLLCYHIRLAGQFFASHDTADLADKVAEHFTAKQLKELYEIPR